MERWPSLPSLPHEQKCQCLCLTFSYFLTFFPSFSFLFFPFPLPPFPIGGASPGQGQNRPHPAPLPGRCRPMFKLHPSSIAGPDFSKDNSKPEVPVRSKTAFYHHLPAAKRKVEEMEVDDFYDGIKRLYNEDNASENVGSVCGTDLSRQESHASPCPPLQPVSVM